MSISKLFKTGDTVQVISGDNKGKTAKIVSMQPREGKALLEGIGERTRHVRANQYNPKGSKKSIHVGIDISKLKLVKREEANKPVSNKAKTAKTEKKGDKK